MLGPPPGPSAPKPPSPFAATPLPVGSGDVVAAQKKAAVDVSGLEADAANLPPAEGDIAGAKAKAKKDVAALEKDAAKLKPAAAKKAPAAPVPQPIPAAAPPAPVAMTPAAPATVAAPPGAPSKEQVEATLGKSISDAEYLAHVSKPQYPQYAPVQQPTFKGLAF